MSIVTSFRLLSNIISHLKQHGAGDRREHGSISFLNTAPDAMSIAVRRTMTLMSSFRFISWEGITSRSG
jgi:hypothetical protein